jgi:ferredoxin
MKMKVPVIDIGECTECEGCMEICPEVFFKNEAGGYFDVRELESYPVEDVDEAIKNCPVKCISWEEL